MPQTYTFASWNVNGLRAVLKKGPELLFRSRKNSTSTSWRCRRPSCKRVRSILTCPAITKPGATPSVKAIRALRSLAARNALRVLHADALLPYAGEGEWPSCRPSRNRGPRLRARVRQVLVRGCLHAQRPK